MRLQKEVGRGEDVRPLLSLKFKLASARLVQATGQACPLLTREILARTKAQRVQRQLNRAREFDTYLRYLRRANFKRLPMGDKIPDDETKIREGS